MYPIILASASPRRKELLGQAGISFNCIPSNKEEVITQSSPEKVVRELSIQKARDVAESVKAPAIIIGADTVVTFDNRILGKPKSVAEAYVMLKMLQGNVHSVYTGVTIIIKEENKEEEITFAEKTRVWMHEIQDQQIRDYVSSGEPMDKAGAYAIQGKGAVFIKKIEGDYNNVVGFPLSRFCQVMQEKGYNVLNF